VGVLARHPPSSPILKVFVQSPKFAGPTITEIKPDHAGEEGALLLAFAGSPPLQVSVALEPLDQLASDPLHQS
jgi:hypothetical protein